MIFLNGTQTRPANTTVIFSMLFAPCQRNPHDLHARFEKWLHALKFDELYGKMNVELDEALKKEEGVEDMVRDLKKINADAEKRQLMITRLHNGARVLKISLP